MTFIKVKDDDGEKIINADRIIFIEMQDNESQALYKIDIIFDSKYNMIKSLYFKNPQMRADQYAQILAKLAQS